MIKKNCNFYLMSQFFLYPDISGLPPQLLMNGEQHTHVPAASHDADNCENNLHFMPLF